MTYGPIQQLVLLRFRSNENVVGVKPGVILDGSFERATAKSGSACVAVHTEAPYHALPLPCVEANDHPIAHHCVSYMTFSAKFELIGATSIAFGARGAGSAEKTKGRAKAYDPHLGAKNKEMICSVKTNIHCRYIGNFSS